MNASHIQLVYVNIVNILNVSIRAYRYDRCLLCCLYYRLSKTTHATFFQSENIYSDSFKWDYNFHSIVFRVMNRYGRRKSISRNIFNKLESFVGYKYPKFITDILLKHGFDCEYAIEQINEKTLEQLESEIKEPLYENSSENLDENCKSFKFLLGHRAIILNIPETLKAYKSSKTRKTEKKVKQNTDLDREELKKLLLSKILRNLTFKKVECAFGIENLRKFTVVENRVACSVKCAFCEIEVPCTFDQYWRISNFSAHICGHPRPNPNHLENSVQNRLEPRLEQSEKQFQRARTDVLNTVQSEMRYMF